ncbi:MAG: D-glycero-beta-D-manno-heptose-7-phosphate kinase [Deltaproteobacteria bacterium]|nr:D-glycero-beta-D-manno-heptose-7-phosphate kinase [Deltaproteobacteria bacterium]
MGEKGVSDLSKYLKSFPNKKIAVVGDLMLDRYVFGEVERISPEGPVPVLTVRREEDRPGGAANVAQNLQILGAQVFLFGIVGSDSRGEELLRLLQTLRIDISGILTDPSRPTISKTRVVARSQQMLRIDRESREEVEGSLLNSVAQKLVSRLSDFDAIVLSDYAKGVVASSLIQQVAQAALRRSLPVFADPKGKDFTKYQGITVLTPNERELEKATAIEGTDLQSLERAAQELFSKVKIPWIVATRGGEGSATFNRGGAMGIIPTEPVEVVDVTGAGDTFLSVLALAWVSGATPLEAAQLATIAGTAVVQRFGAVSLTLQELEAKIALRGSLGRSKILTREQLSSALSQHRTQGEKVVFTNGCFDLLHIGHVEYLKAARERGDILVLGVNSDRSVKELKGEGRPLIPEQERVEILAALHSVDYVVLFDESTPEKLIRAVRPDVLIKGADYSLDGVVGRGFVESYGGRVELIPLVENRSTSKIIEQIVERYR